MWITVIRFNEGRHQVKTISLKNNKIHKQPAENSSKGDLVTIEIEDMYALKGLMMDLFPEESLSTGIVHKLDEPLYNEPISLVKKGKESEIGCSRTKKFLRAEKNAPGLIMFDFDDTTNSYKELIEIIPELKNVCALEVDSAGSNIYDGKGNQLIGSKGHHVYFGINDLADAERISKIFWERQWLAGKGFFKYSNATECKPSLLERGLWDNSVTGKPARLIYEAPVILLSGLTQKKEYKVYEGVLLDTSTISNTSSKDLNLVYKMMQDSKNKTILDFASEMERLRLIFVAKTGSNKQWHACDLGIIPFDTILYLNDDTTIIAGALNESHNGMGCADPFEPYYQNNLDTSKALIYFSNGKISISSMAHGQKWLSVGADMNDKTAFIQVPSNIDLTKTFLSSMPLFNLNIPSCLLGKGMTGCGITTVSFLCSERYVTVVPLNSIVESKKGYNNGMGLEVFAFTDADRTKAKLVAYFERKKALNEEPKIIVVYDSLAKLNGILETIRGYEPKTFNILIDEVHMLTSTADYRISAINNVKKYIIDYKQATFTTATNHDDNYIPNWILAYGRKELVWSNPPKNSIDLILATNKNIYNTTLKEVRRLLNSDPTLKVYVFNDSVIENDQLVEDIGLGEEDCCRVQGKRYDEEFKDGKIIYKKNLDNTNTVANATKRLNTLTSAGFEGWDLKETNVAFVINGSCGEAFNKRYLDIRTSVIQILGRKRIGAKHATFITTVNKFYGRVPSRISAKFFSDNTDTIEAMISQMNADYVKKVNQIKYRSEKVDEKLRKELIKKAKLSENNPIYFDDETNSFRWDKAIEQQKLMKKRIKYDVYVDRYSLLRELALNDIDVTSISDSEEPDVDAKEKVKTVSVGDFIKAFESVNFDVLESVETENTILAKYSWIPHDIFDYLNLETIKLLNNKKDIMKEYNKAKFDDNGALFETVYGKRVQCTIDGVKVMSQSLSQGNRLHMSQLRRIFTKAIKTLGSSEEFSLALVEKFFLLKEFKTKKMMDGKIDKNYGIIMVRPQYQDIKETIEVEA